MPDPISNPGPPIAPPIDDHILTLIRLAIQEDLGPADLTSELAIPAELQGRANIVARRPGILSGSFLLDPILQEYPHHSSGLKCRLTAQDGARLSANQTLATLTGPVRTILTAERVLLNFLGRLCGIATLTRRYVDAVAAAGCKTAICDTRKTTPGWRILEKYAVRCGGGVNHRLGLYDGVMLKDNHLAALRQKLGGEGGGGESLAQLTSAIRAGLDPSITLWLEVDTLEQLREALAGGTGGVGGGADIILLDNFTPDQLRQAVQLRNQSAIGNPQSAISLEASGGITLDNIAEIAKTGVDRISIGALTHSAPVLDVAMELT